MTNKMTNRRALEYVLENCTIPIEVAEKLENMIASLEKKAANPSRKPTAKQTENAGLRNTVYDFLLNSGAKMTCTELGKAVPELNDLSNQRISALLRPLVADGSVLKDTAKGKTVFYAVPLETVVDD